MSFWKKIPYWLKGGIIGGGIAIIFIVLFYSCGFFSTYSSNEYAGFGCLFFLMYGPMQLTVWLLDILSLILNIEPLSNSGVFNFEILMMISIFISFVIGLIIGMLIGLVKSKKRSTQ